MNTPNLSARPAVSTCGYSGQATSEDRLQAIKLRRLEIDATLAEWKRSFFVDGVERPFADRVALEAEYAQLALERRLIENAAHKAKLERRERERRTLHYQLIAVLTELGMTDIIAEAQARADMSLMDAAIPPEAASIGAVLDVESLEQGEPAC